MFGGVFSWSKILYENTRHLFSYIILTMEGIFMSDEFNNSGVVGEVVTQSTLSDKSKVAAALLSFFLGMFGIHRFYLGRVGSGAAMLILTIVGWLTTGIIVGMVLLFVVGIWDVIDFFRILFNSLGDSQGRKLR